MTVFFLINCNIMEIIIICIVFKHKLQNMLKCPALSLSVSKKLAKRNLLEVLLIHLFYQCILTNNRMKAYI